MNKLTEQHLLKKSRFLKYSLFASISVGAIIAIPFEGMAMSKEAFRIDLSNKLLNHVSQLNGHKDKTNTPQQIGTVIVPEPEINTYTPSEIREMKISNKPKTSNPLKDVPIEDHYKVVARSKSDVGKARKVRPITRRKTFAGTEKTAQSQSTYTPESIEQMPQKSEIIITESSPTFSPDSNGFVTAPNTPNTTLTSPEHYTTAPGTPSSTPATPYQPTSDSKPNDSLGANTPPNINTNSKAARRLSFSSSNPQQQAVQSSSQVKPEVPLKPTFVPLPTKKSSTEIAAGMVSNISRVNEIIGIKLAEVTQAIKDTTGKKNKKPLQKLYTQLTSAQKTTEELKSRAEEIETKIKIGKNKDKIKKLEKELTSKNNKADRLFQKIEKIDIPANKVSIKSQETVPVTTASTKVSAFQAQQARINEARQGIFNKNKSSGDNARKSSARTEREKKKQEAQKQLSEIKKQEKAIKTASDKAKEVAASVKKETSRTALRAMQDKMNGDSDGPTYKQPPKAKPTIPLSHGVQRILCEQPEDEEGYLVPRKVQQQPYTVMLPNQEIEDPIPSHSKDIYESKVSQYINYLNSIQPNQSNQAQIDSVIDSLATEMRKFSADQFSQKLGEIAHLASIEAYNDLFEKLYEIQQARIPETQKVYKQEEIFQSYAEYEENLRKSSTPVLSRSSSAKSVISSNFEEKSALLQTTTTDESLRSDNNWKNPAPYSSSPKLDKRGLEYLDLAGDAFVQNLKQPDTLTIEALSLITPTQNTTVAKSDSSRKNNVSGSIPEIQQLQSEKMRTETLGVQDDLELYLHYTPQETLTEESTYLVSSKNKQGNIIKRAVSKLLQTTTTDESLRSDNNWKNPAPYSSSPKLDKRGLEYLDLAGDAFVQNLKQPDTLTIEALSLITPTQNTTVAKSDSSRKNNVSGSIPEIQQLQSEKMRTETLGVQDDLELYLHYTPQETLTEESTYLVSSKNKQGNIIKRAVSKLLQTTTTDESLRSDNNWKNPAPYSSSPKLDKRGLEYLDLAGDAFVQNLKQPDTLTIEALSLITPTQNTTVAKSDSSRKNNVSGSIPEIQQLQSEKMRTETLGVQDDLELYLHYTPQETLTEESTYLVSSKNKQGNIIKRAVSKIGSILQTNYAENRKRKRDGETSKQRTVDQEGEFGHAWGNENHNVVSGFTKKATQLISLLDAKRTAILQTTSPSQRKSLSLVLQEIENDYREAIKISQELQQVLIRKPEDIKAYNSKAEKKLDAIKSRADKYFNNIETDADVGFNPNGGNNHSMPTANMDSLPKNLAVTPPINVGSLYNSPQAQQFREDHIVRELTDVDASIYNTAPPEVVKEAEALLDRSQGRLNLVDSTIVRELTDVDASIYNTAPPEVVKEAEALLDRSQDRLNLVDSTIVRELTDVDASIYNIAPPEVVKEAEALLDRSQDRLNLVDSTIKKGTQPLSTIYESVSYENLASETIYKTEQPKPSISYTNTSKRKLPIPLFRSADLDKKLEYLDLEDKLLEVEEARIVKEKQAIATLDQYQDPENPEFKRLAMEALDLSSKESQLKAKRKTIAAEFSLNEKSSSTDVSILRSYSIDDISSALSDAESNLSRSPSVSGLEDLNNSNVMKLGELKSKHKKIANDYKAKELELDTLNHDDPEKIWLEGEIKHLDTESKPKVNESKPVFSCSSSVGSINSFSNGDNLSSRDVVTSVDTLTREIDKDYVDTYIRVLSNKIQKIEELPGSSSRSEELNHIKEAMAYISNRIQDVEELDEKMLLAINARLQEHDEKISSLLLEKYTGEEAADILAQSLLQEMLVSDGKSESILPAGDEEQEDTEVSRQLSSLPALASSNECALALSDDREKECLALGDGSEDEESYDSGFEEEEETIGQLSDSDGGNLKITEVDTAIPLEQEAKKEMQTQISENAPTLNQAKVVNTIVNNMIRNRLDASMNMSNNMVAVGAGDEEESHIKRGLWMRGMYGTNNHGRVENMTGYRGTNKGATIGFDAEIDNNIVGIAYSNVHSVFKFKNSKNNDKELINSHVVSIYGQKELPKNFALQALVSASKNFIKDKTTYSYGDTKIRSNVKHRNNSYNAEALLQYNYLLQSKFVITPNIGLRYVKSRDGVYNEIGVNVQEIALTMKENNILSGIVGTKVTVPLKDALKFNNLSLTFQGAVEHNFKEKTQRINRVVKIFDNTFKHNYLIPKQPKTSYNLGTGIIGSIKNTTISLDYNYYLNKHYRSHQGSVKLKVNL
nr:autotransporter outer membrane beta-barrel domain-containing protein [Rickettsia japonica]